MQFDQKYRKMLTISFPRLTLQVLKSSCFWSIFMLDMSYCIPPCRIKMRLIIFGSTGKTGELLLQKALDQGHHVTAIVRDPSKITIKHEKLSINQVNIFDQEELVPLFKDADAVISTLGFKRKPKPVVGYLRFAEASTKALRNVECKRLIVMHSWFTKEGTFFLLLFFWGTLNSSLLAGSRVLYIFINLVSPINFREKAAYLYWSSGLGRLCEQHL